VVLVHEIPVHDLTVLPRKQIVIDPEKNARRTMYAQPVEDLARSIGDKGLLHPVGVRPVGDPEAPEPFYELVFGYRRMRAMDLLGLQLIPVAILDVDDVRAHEIMLEENIHREDVPAWDLGRAVVLLHERGHSLPEICARLSMIAGRSLKMVRLQRLAVTVSSLHPDLLEIWKRNTESLDEDRAFQISREPLESQMEIFEQMIGGSLEEPEPKRPPVPGDRKRGPRRSNRRPSVRATELAYLSLKQHEDDEHDDGFENGEQRAGAKLVLQWILGGRTRCPIKPRKKDKRKR